MENYRVENPEIFYTKRGLTEVATVIDSNTGEVVETIELVPNLTRATVSSHTLRRSSNFGGVTLQLSVNIELYSNGSFRQINSVQGHYLGITSSFTSTYIEGQNVNVWSAQGYPTQSIKYAYNGTLATSINASLTAQYSAKFASGGFAFSGTVSGTSYYRRAFSENGTLSVN